MNLTAIESALRTNAATSLLSRAVEIQELAAAEGLHPARLFRDMLEALVAIQMERLGRLPEPPMGLFGRN
jgi:hypothetical protein